MASGHRLLPELRPCCPRARAVLTPNLDCFALSDSGHGTASPCRASAKVRQLVMAGFITSSASTGSGASSTSQVTPFSRVTASGSQ